MQLVDQMPPDRRKSKNLDLYLQVIDVPVGTVILLKQGEDFNGSPESLRVSMKQWLRRNGIEISTSVINDDVYVKVIENKETANV